MHRLESFDKFSLEYDKWFESHETEYKLELNAIKTLIPHEGKGIEIGAGTGRFTQPLGIALGIEPSKSMSDIATSRGVNIIAGRAESLPIESSSYDYALFVTTDCFLDTPADAYKEARRILKQGGFILIGMIDKKSTLGKKYESMKHKSRFYKDATFHSVQEIQAELEKTGFSNFEYAQAILPGDHSTGLKPGVVQGFGIGSFVVLRAQKNGT